MVAAELTALVLTNEYPPSVYGGAGIHVAELTRALRGRIGLDIRTFGDHDEADAGFRVHGYGATLASETADARMRPALTALARDLAMASDPVSANVVHCHTWYTHLGGLLVRQAYGLPLVVTVHSLEPLRPWKREQLGGGYDLSTWVERTALRDRPTRSSPSAEGTRDDVLRLFDVADRSASTSSTTASTPISTARSRRPTCSSATGSTLGRRTCCSSGRITRQKGIVHLVRAHRARSTRASQVVLCAGAARHAGDRRRDGGGGGRGAARIGRGVVWIPEMLSRADDASQLYSHAAVFCCPSVYEPFGIINLEAMACGRAGGRQRGGRHSRVVVDGETGMLVPSSCGLTIRCARSIRQASRPIWPPPSTASWPMRPSASAWAAPAARVPAAFQLGGDCRPDGEAVPLAGAVAFRSP